MELDISELEERNFYYDLRPFLDKKTLESIDKKEKKLAKSLLAEKTDDFFTKLVRRYILKPKIIKKIKAKVKLEEMLRNKSLWERIKLRNKSYRERISIRLDSFWKKMVE